MSTAGVGIDILEVARMQRALDRRPSIVWRMFTDEERLYCEGTARPAEHYAARFAAREAVLKALGCGFGKGVKVKDVSVAHADNGRPVAVLRGRVREIAAERGVTEVALSLSFTHEVATAMALLVTEEVRPKPKGERDPERELLSSFKEARSVIDELERLQGDIASLLEKAPPPQEMTADDEGDTRGGAAHDEESQCSLF
ncbi:MAG: holo-ACP synthase [Acidobacteriota bacterium]|nr:holo-ACP synthase [Acidobacteriota bacterium]